MAYDPVRKMVVMFGGFQFTNGQILGDTWEWDGKEWRPMRPAHSPPARAQHAMAYDPNTGRVLLFGGTDRTVNYGDTWCWDGQDWRLLQPARSPSGRWACRMVTDPVRKTILLHGGARFSPGIVSIDETWEWNGNSWSQRFPKTASGRRHNFGMAWHAKSGRIVLFGGKRDSLYYTDTWTWDGSDWRRHNVTEHPVHSGTTLAADPITGHVLGLEPPPPNQPDNHATWRWDGTRWIRLKPNPRPRCHRNGHMSALKA